MTPEHMPADLAATLSEHSPQLVIHKPTLIRWTDSPTGWLLVVPESPDAPTPLKIGFGR